jgi:FMN reductase (NADPH)/FMN reductase [NAD(P)H]
MNETLRVIDRRRSTRTYLDEPLTPAEKDAILHAAMRAPTAGNMMLYTIIEVEDQALKDRLAVTCDNQPFIARAPYVLLFLADYQRWFDYYTLSSVRERCAELGLPYREPQAGDLLLACCDALIAAQNAVIAAESLGIGSCYIGDILENCEIHRSLFNLPRYTLPVTLLCFGRPPREHAARSRTSRFDREFIVHQNGYRRLDAGDMERMFAHLNSTVSLDSQSQAQNYGQFQYFRKFNADFSIEMSRSVRELLKDWE